MSTTWPSGAQVDAMYTPTGWRSDHLVTSNWPAVTDTYDYDAEWGTARPSQRAPPSNPTRSVEPR